MKKNAAADAKNAGPDEEAKSGEADIEPEEPEEMKASEEKKESV